MTLKEKILFTLVFVLVVIGVVLSRVNLTFYEGVYVVEDGFIEWLTVLALFAGFVICMYRIYVFRLQKGAWFVVGLLILGFLYLFGAGEEISWGQRLFNFKSSPFFVTYNSQMETNFHNLVFEGKKINKIIFGTFLGICIGFYFLILPVLYKKVLKVKKLVDNLAIPIPRIFHIVAYLILVGLVELITSGKKGEILEFGGCWIFFLMTLFPSNLENFRKS